MGVIPNNEESNRGRNKMRKGLFFSIIAMLTVSCFADTLIVDLDGYGDYLTIQSAVNAAQDGDTVLIRDGVYTGNKNRNILIDGKQLKISSENGNSNCIIDCNELGEGFYIWESENVIIRGLTIVNGKSVKKPMEENGGGAIEAVQSIVEIQSCKFKNCYASNLGGGIYCHGRSGNVNIEDCIFEDCESGYRGGAVATQWSGLHLRSCVIKDCNSYIYGGGVYAYLARGSFENVLFERNHSLQGGGVYFASFRADINKCHFLNNHAGFNGSGVHARNSKLDINNCLLEGNGWELEASGAIYGEDSEIDLVFSTLSHNRVGFRGLGGDLLTVNCIFWGNLLEIFPVNMDAVNVLYSNIENGYSGPGNINIDPLFKYNGYWESEQEYVSGDYRLTRTSPCIEAGVTWSKINNDILSKPRPYDWEGIDNNGYHADVDMGCYELQKTRPVADAGMDQFVYAFVNGYTLVDLDGTGSYDADGDALEYFWYNDANELIATGAEPNVVLPVGEHVFDLIVNDGLEDSEPNSCTVTVIEAMETEAKLTPQVLNRKSSQPYVIGRLELAGYSAIDIDPNEPMVLMPGDIAAERMEILPGKNGAESTTLVGFFDHTAMMDAIDNNPLVPSGHSPLAGGELEVTIAAKLLTGQWVYGTDVVKIK